MYLSQKQAKKILQTDAGFTIAAATEAIGELKKYPFGKREKIKMADLSRIIAEANKPSVIVPTFRQTIRPFRKELREQISK